MAPGLDCSAASLLCCEDVSACLSQDGDHEASAPGKRSRFPSLLWEASSSWRVSAAMELEEACDLQATLSALAEREECHMPSSDYAHKYESKLLDEGFRQKAINWLLKVRDFYNFGPVTTALSINYLDRFLSRHQLPNGKAWMIQLLSVACLSLAAKMEETEVPLLLDLQVGPGCIFEPRTIQRMELLVLSTLEWRLSSVTPFSYIDYLVCKFDLEESKRGSLCSRINDLITCAVQEIKFVCYPPSSVAAAAVLCAAQEMCSSQFKELKKILFSLFPLKLHDSSERCFMLMSEMFFTPICTSKDETCGNSVPQSPIGVLDASFSSDSESMFKSVGSDPSVQVSSPAQNKRRKLEHSCSSVKVCAT